MEEKEFEEAVEYCLDLKSEGRDYDFIRNDLRSKKVTEEEIKPILKETDNRYLSGLIETKKGFEFNSKWLGLALIFIGVVVTLSTIIWVEHFNGTFYIFMFGPMAAGTAVYYGGSRKHARFFKRKQDQWNRRF